MNFSLYLLYLAAAAATVASPGPGVLMTLMRSMQWGYRWSIWTVTGIATGVIVMAGISATGLSFLLAQSPLVYDWMRIIGACYMVWLGIKNWRVKTVSLGAALRQHSTVTAKKEKEEPAHPSPRGLWLESVGLQMTNPMLIMFFISLFPQFIDPAYDYTLQFVVLTLTFAALVMVIHSGYAIAVTYFRGFLNNPSISRLIYRAGGTIFILLALKVFSQVFF